MLSVGWSEAMAQGDWGPTINLSLLGCKGRSYRDCCPLVVTLVQVPPWQVQAEHHSALNHKNRCHETLALEYCRCSALHVKEGGAAKELSSRRCQERETWIGDPALGRG